MAAPRLLHDEINRSNRDPLGSSLPTGATVGVFLLRRVLASGQPLAPGEAHTFFHHASPILEALGEEGFHLYPVIAVVLVVVVAAVAGGGGGGVV